MKMKKLFAALLAIAMFSVMAMPAFADANSDYLAAVKAYQNQIAAREEAYAAAVKTYQAQSAAKAKAEGEAIIAAGKAAAAAKKAEAEKASE